MPTGGAPSKNGSIRTRLSLTVAGILVVAVLVVTIIALREQRRQAHAELKGKGESLVLFLARVSPIGILALNFVELNNQVRQVVATDDTAVYAAILNDEGFPLATYLKATDPLVAGATRAGAGALDTMAALRATDLVLEVSAPIHAGEKSIGTARLGLSFVTLRRALLRQVIVIGLATLVIVAASVVLLRLALGKLLRPIESLTAAAAAISAGNLDVAPIGTERADELGILARSFESMARQLRELISGLEQKVADINRLNEELALRVHERTALLEALNREIEAFAYSVSHDLRAPLRHIDGFLELLRERTAGSLDPQSRHFMATAAGSAKRLGTLMDDLLEFSRMGRVELTRSSVDVGALVREVRAAIELEAGGRAVAWNVGSLPTIDADARMLRLALTSLLSNAVKFTRTSPRPEIAVGSFEPPGGSEIVLFVRDNGVGFDMRYVGKLFRVFQRLHRSDDGESTGIGLANVRRVAERHGGRVWAEGTPGEGASFYIAFPTHPAQRAVPTDGGSAPASSDRGREK